MQRHLLGLRFGDQLLQSVERLAVGNGSSNPAVVRNPVVKRFALITHGARSAFARKLSYPSDRRLRAKIVHVAEESNSAQGYKVNTGDCGANSRQMTRAPWISGTHSSHHRTVLRQSSVMRTPVALPPSSNGMEQRDVAATTPFPTNFPARSALERRGAASSQRSARHPTRH